MIWTQVDRREVHGVKQFRLEPMGEQGDLDKPALFSPDLTGKRTKPSMRVFIFAQHCTFVNS